MQQDRPSQAKTSARLRLPPIMQDHLHGSLILSDYEARHLVAHLANGGCLDGLSELLRLETEDGQNAWYRLKVARQERADYRLNIELAFASAESVGDVALWALQLRYTLICASLNSLAAKVAPTILETAVERQIWTSAEAVSAASRNPDAEQRVRALLAISQVLRDTPREEVLRAALAEALAIPEGDFRDSLTYKHWHLEMPKERWFDRAEAVAIILSHLPATLHGSALAAIRAIASATGRVRAICAFLPVATNSIKPAIIEEAFLVFEKADCFTQATMVDELVSHLDTAGQARLLEAIAKVNHDASRSRALRYCANRLPDSLFSRALEIAYGIEWQTARLEAACDLLARAPVSDLESLADSAFTESQPEVRSRLLLALAPRLSPLRRVRALVTAFEDVNRSDAPADCSIVSKGEGKVSQLIKIVQLAEGGLKERATSECLKLIETVEETYRRAEQLRDLAPRSAGNAFCKMLDVVAALGDEEWQAHAIEYLAPHFPAQNIDRAFAVAASIKSEYCRFAAIASIAPRLSVTQWRDILGNWESLKSDYGRHELARAAIKSGHSELLESLAPKLLDIADPKIRCEALCDVVLVAASPLANLLATAAFDAANQIGASDAISWKVRQSFGLARSEVSCLTFRVGYAASALILHWRRRGSSQTHVIATRTRDSCDRMQLRT
jgi:hypothetical protein